MSAKIFQKNKILNYLNDKIIDLEKKIHEKDDKIFEINNELLFYKNLHGNANISMTSIDIPDINLSNSLMKKKKVDDYVNFTKN